MAATAFGPVEEHNEAATVRVSNLDPECDEELLWELMVQAGPVGNVHIIKDKVTGDSQGTAMVEFKLEEDCDYACNVLNMVKLYGKPIRMMKVATDAPQQHIDIGANLFIGNLDPDVDEKLLQDTFQAFGGIATEPKIARDDSGMSKCFGFVSFNTFDAADNAIEALNNRFLMNRKISLQYAMKKDGKEQHGTDAERFLAGQPASEAPPSRKTRPVPNRFFTTGPGQPITGPADDSTVAAMRAAPPPNPEPQPLDPVASSLPVDVVQQQQQLPPPPAGFATGAPWNAAPPYALPPPPPQAYYPPPAAPYPPTPPPVPYHHPAPSMPPPAPMPAAPSAAFPPPPPPQQHPPPPPSHQPPPPPPIPYPQPPPPSAVQPPPPPR